MRSVKQIKKLRYTNDWVSNVDDSNITYRLFTYNGLTSKVGQLDYVVMIVMNYMYLIQE
jgi:hypothetical protein